MDTEQAKEVIFRVVGLYGSLKNFHYTPTGLSFFATHKEADHILEDLLDIVDEIQEQTFMGNLLETVDWNIILANSSPYVTSLSGTNIMDDILSSMVSLSEFINGIDNSTRSDNAILDKLDGILAQGIGFLYYSLPDVAVEEPEPEEVVPEVEAIL